MCVAGLLSPPSHAQTYTVYVAPAFLYDDGDTNPPTPLETSATQAFADVQALDYCSSSYGTTTCYSFVNPHPEYTLPPAIVFNNSVNYLTWFDKNVCNTPGSCTYTSDVGRIQADYLCPPGFSASDSPGTDSNPRHDTVRCQASFPAAQPPPKGCKSCIGGSTSAGDPGAAGGLGSAGGVSSAGGPIAGGPIYGGAGINFQSETDYAGPSGLTYKRAYRSDIGSWSSISSASFIDYSQANATTTNNCYQSYYTNPDTQAIVSNCFAYISTGLSAYQLATTEGRLIQFSGPNNAVTQNADINDRVTQITVSGVTEWQVRREDDSTEIYSTAGSLLQRTERGGRTFTLTYSTASTPSSIAPRPGLLLSQSDAFGHTLSWQYNALTQVSQMTDPAGGIYQFSYGTAGNLTSVQYPDGTTKSYSYNESADTGGANLPNALTGITDESSVRYSTFQYAANVCCGLAAFAVNTQHAGGVGSYTLTYDGAAAYGTPITSTVVTDPLGTSKTYTFQQKLSYNDDSSQIQPAASGSGTVNQAESFDANGNVSQLVDFNGNTTLYTFDLTRNLETSRTEASGTAQARTITTQWNASWRQPALITEPNRTTAFTYDSLGNVLTKTITDTTVTPNASRTWTYTYDGYGRMLTAKGPRTDVNSTTTYTYYTCTTGSQCGQLQTVTDPVGNVTTFNTYNAHGQPLTITDPNGVVTTLTYDARTRLTSRQVGSETTSFSYYPTGLLKQVTLPDSSYVLYTYDSGRRLTQITDGAGNSIQYTLDAMGNRTAEKTYDPSSTLHRTHTRVYNALNEIYQDVNAANTSAVTTTYAYDNDGNQTSIAAPLSRNTINVYDPLNRLSQITDPNSGNTYLTYDAEDDLTAVTDSRSLTTSYGYNGFGNVKTQSSPDTGTTTSTYDSGGNLATSTDARGALSTYAYDAQNRVTSIVYSLSGVSDQTIVFGYDAGTNGKGRLTSASDANHSLSWSYDTHGRVTGKGLTVGGVNAAVGYGYTNADLTALVTPSGQAVTYGYNSNHQITSIAVNGTTVLSGVTYEPFGGVNGWAWGNASTTTRTFNTDGIISQIVTASVTLGYSYDNANRVTAISDSSDSALSWTYGYDLLDRLTSAATTAITDGWTYDGNGNRLTQTGTTPITFSVNSANNQLSATTGSLVRSYVYDAAGNTESYGTLTFGYNDRGRMNSTGGGSTNYLYNALGQMIEKSGTPGKTIFMQDEAGHLIGEYDGSGNLIEETVWLGDTPLATLQPNGSGGVNIFYVHTDHLNAPRKVSRPSDNQLEWRWDADPFGTAAANQNPTGLGTFVYNLRFPGQYYMAETGLNQNYHRDLDPSIGRYVESDPVGLKAGVNTYAYVYDDPVQRFDPTGLLTCSYAIAARQLNCTNDAGQSLSVSGDHVKSGLGPCQDNPACMGEKNQGPLPVGQYQIHPPGYSPNHARWLYLQPSKQNNMGPRGGFFIHPWGISNGCIAIYFNSDFKTLSEWAVQDNGGDLNVSQ
jgi:RHS repeat-associated protein